MTTRREAISLLSSLSAGAFFPALHPELLGQDEPTPPLAPGAPMSPERIALIDAFKLASEGIDKKFEARSFKGEWTMPYRLFRPAGTARLPLVVFLHGSGGLGDDNEKQMGLGNIFGTRVFAMPNNQKSFPCYVVAPQTDRGWMNYAPPAAGDSVATVVPGLGDGAKLAFDVIDALKRELPIDERRIYITGQSMGGGGVWHMVAQRPNYFAAAVPCCGSAGVDDVAATVKTPVWNFHGDADKTVAVAVSRIRIAELRKAGGYPIATEYAGVGHNSWEWAYTEPALVKWMFGKRLRA